MIENATYNEMGAIRAVIDGVELTVPDDMANRHRRMIAEWEASGGVIAPYTAPSPSTDPHDFPLSPYQFRAMLKIAGIEATIIQAISDIADPAERAVAEAKLDYALSYQRGDPLFAMLAPAVGLTGAQIDALWLEAKDL